MKTTAIAVLALLALVAVSYERTVTAQPSRDLAVAQAEASLGVSRLLGTWACGGHDAARKRFAADVTWYHDLSALHFEILPDSSDRRRAPIAEVWKPGAGDSGAPSWRAEPERDGDPREVFRSEGRRGDRIVWTRTTPGPSQRRIFERVGENRLRVVVVRAMPADAYFLDCRRVDARDSLSI